MDQKEFEKIIYDQIPEKVQKGRTTILPILLDGSYRIFGKNLTAEEARIYGQYLKVTLESENMNTELAIKDAQLKASVGYEQKLEKILVEIKKSGLRT